MPVTDRSMRLTDVASLDGELEALQHAVAAARRNRWHGGDVMGPEFENFLASLTRSPSFGYGRGLPQEPRPRRRNLWLEVVDAEG